MASPRLPKIPLRPPLGVVTCCRSRPPARMPNQPPCHEIAPARYRRTFRRARRGVLMRLLRVGFACLLCAAVLALPGAALAARRAPAAPAAPTPGGDDKDKPPFKAAILIEADSGQVL